MFFIFDTYFLTNEFVILDETTTKNIYTLSIMVRIHYFDTIPADHLLHRHSKALGIHEHT